MSKIHHSHASDLVDSLKDFDGQAASYRRVFEVIGRGVAFSQIMLISTFPRGGTQILQPSSVPEAFVKAYSKGLFATDGPTWQAILKAVPVTGNDCVSSGTLHNSEYYRQLMEPNGLAHVVAVRIQSPVFEGYPGVLHLYRGAGEPAFTPDDLSALHQMAGQFGKSIDVARESRALRSCGKKLPWDHRDVPRQFVFDRQGRQLSLPSAQKSVMDDQLTAAIKELVANRLESVDGELIRSDRVILPDKFGEKWAFRTVLFREFPALGKGPFVFLCIQPSGCEWTATRPEDFQADVDVSRLIPTLKFMQAEYTRLPTLTEISAKAHLSPFHFHRRFTELLGQTPKHFMLSCQIARAKRMLMERKVTLSEIAAECGFSHQSHFTSRFKQASGLTPTRWRRHANEHLKGRVASE